MPGPRPATRLIERTSRVLSMRSVLVRFAQFWSDKFAETEVKIGQNWSKSPRIPRKSPKPQRRGDEFRVQGLEFKGGTRSSEPGVSRKGREVRKGEADGDFNDRMMG